VPEEAKALFEWAKAITRRNNVQQIKM